MDFALLFGLYILVCCCGIGCYLTSTVLSNNPLFTLCRLVTEIGEEWLPDSVVRVLSSAYFYLFFQRNPVFLCVYLSLLCGTHTVALIDVLPVLYSKAPETNHVFWILLFLVLHLVCFVWCSWSDPGVLTAVTLEKYRHLYTADGCEGDMYKPQRVCDTCRIDRLPRSKHCAFTDRCIFKYDHYCILTASAIGGLNYRYFVGLLLSACAMCTNGVILCTQALGHIINVRQLWRARYVDTEGIPQPMNYFVLSQTLFMQYPRLVILQAALSVITCGVLFFALYHLYLVFTNQTTSERYKLALKEMNSTTQLSCYNDGILSNIREFFFPLKNHRTLKLLERGKESRTTVFNKSVAQTKSVKRQRKSKHR